MGQKFLKRKAFEERQTVRRTDKPVWKWPKISVWEQQKSMAMFGIAQVEYFIGKKVVTHGLLNIRPCLTSGQTQSKKVKVYARFGKNRYHFNT